MTPPLHSDPDIDPLKATERWDSPRLRQPLTLCRWGTYGTPVLLFPTAGGDAEEVERFLMMKALKDQIVGGKIKVYSVDSTAGAAWLSGDHSPAYCSKLQNLYDDAIVSEVVPAIRADCRSQDVEIIVAGASIGAFNALASICRHPDVFSLAICMSGTYELSKWLQGQPMNTDFHVSSPLHWLPQHPEDSPTLAKLRQRFVILATGNGRYEDAEESWLAGKVLGSRGVPNRVDAWGEDWHHDWVTWRAMLPKYLGEHVG